MKIMAIDYGDAHTGVALSDPTGFLAGSATTIHSRKEEVVLSELARMVRENQVDELVMGAAGQKAGGVGKRHSRVGVSVINRHDPHGLHVLSNL